MGRSKVALGWRPLSPESIRALWINLDRRSSNSPLRFFLCTLLQGSRTRPGGGGYRKRGSNPRLNRRKSGRASQPLPELPCIPEPRALSGYHRPDEKVRTRTIVEEVLDTLQERHERDSLAVEPSVEECTGPRRMKEHLDGGTSETKRLLESLGLDGGRQVGVFDEPDDLNTVDERGGKRGRGMHCCYGGGIARRGTGVVEREVVDEVMGVDGTGGGSSLWDGACGRTQRDGRLDGFECNASANGENGRRAKLFNARESQAWRDGCSGRERWERGEQYEFVDVLLIDGGVRSVEHSDLLHGSVAVLHIAGFVDSACLLDVKAGVESSSAGDIPCRQKGGDDYKDDDTARGDWRLSVS